MQNRFYDRYCKAIGRDDYNCIYEGRVFLSEADTFIEFCFERKCAEMKNGMEMLDEWRYHKNQYSHIIETTIYDFQHYSRHDASHSVSILEVIELIIGETGIALMSRGDLWLLLEAAYSHDIGMAMTGDELYELWSQEDFKNFLTDSLGKSGTDAQNAAIYYKQMDNLLHDKLQMEGFDETKIEAFCFHDYWPAEISNRVQWLVTEYIRRQHAMRNAKMREKIIPIKEPVVPKRLYERVVMIANLHVMEYGDIFLKLPYQEKGAGAEWVHPQFVAAMLRIGDVLDTDNNRFSVYALEHMMEIPCASRNHFFKHQAISQIQISEEKIYVSAISDNRDACKEASYWLESIDREVESIIQNWNNIAPKHLRGCRLKPSHCDVFFINEEGMELKYCADEDKFFAVNKQELIQLLVGTNIYDTELDFVREYLQNALDASKVQLWQDILNNEYEDALGMIKNENLLTPFQIPKEIYDKYRVKLKIEIKSTDPNNVYITIEDYGIGMERECIKVISSLGSGWRNREKYSRKIAQMPLWLRPTGGFGIGIQSAFMMAKEVEIYTKAQGETLGRKIFLESPRLGGKIITEDISKERRGTLVQTKVPISNILSWNQLKKKNDKVEWPKITFKGEEGDIFSADYMEDYIVGLLNKYIELIIPNSLIPISIGAKGLQFLTVKRPLWENCYDGNWSEIRRNGKKYYFQEVDKYILIWDDEKKNLIAIQWQMENAEEKRKNFAYYKNVRMTHEYATRNAMYNSFNIIIDYMGFQARNVLKVHRNEFAEHFDYEKYIDEYVELYLHLFTLAEHNAIKLSIPLWQRQKEFLLTRFFLAEDDGDAEHVLQMIAEFSKDEPEQYKLGKKRIIYRKNEESLVPEFSIFVERVEDCPLLEFCQSYMRMRRGEKVSWLLVEGIKSEEPGKSTILSEIKNWITKNIQIQEEEEEKWIFSNDVQNESIIYKAMEYGFYTGLNSFVPMLLNNATIKTNYNVLDIPNEENEKTGIMELISTSEKVQKTCNEKHFYEQSYNDKQHIFTKDEYPNKYRGLTIETIPYNLSDTLNDVGPYLISPIIDKVKNKYERLSILMMKERVMTNENEFVEEVMKTNEFENLISWVSENAVLSEYKKNKVKIRGLYEVYIRDIFQNCELGKHTKKRN